MGWKNEIMEKFADSLMKMDKEEKKEFLRHVIDSMGESLIEDLTREEKVEILTQAVRDIMAKSGLTDKDEQRELIVALTKNMVDAFLGELKAEEKGEIMTNMVAQAIERIGPEITSMVGSAIRQMIDASPSIGEAMLKMLQDTDIRAMLREFIKGMFSVLKDLLKAIIVEVYGYLKESGPEVMEFLKDAGLTVIKALVRIGMELLRKAIEVISGLMQTGGRTLIQTREWFDKVMASNELRSLKGTMGKMLDDQAALVKKVLSEGVKDMEDLVKKTKMPRESLRNVLLRLWERGEVELDKFELPKPKGGPSVG